MNPLVEKFWNDAGYNIIQWNPPKSDASRRCFWRLYKKDTYTYIGVVGASKDFTGPQPNIAKCYFYYFNSKIYLEEDMLKIIKMKAFI